MTNQELEQERFYREQERLGIMVEDNDPTPAQAKLAREEADKFVKDFSSNRTEFLQKQTVPVAGP